MPIAQENFFLGYNRIMALVYGAIIISAILLFSFLYNDNNQAIIQSINLRLFEHRQSFNGVMRIRYDAVKALQRQARTFINQPFNRFDPDIKLVNMPKLNSFYLEVGPENYESYVSINGMGNYKNFNLQIWQELMMGFRLNSLMVILKNNISNIDSLNYTSKNHFIVSYPHKKQHANVFNTSIYQQEFYQRALPKNNREDKLFWTDVYFNSSRNAFMTVGAAPVYGGTDFKGVVSITFFMDSIYKFFEDISYQFGELYIINEFGTVIGESSKNIYKSNKLKKLADVLPSDLQVNNILQIDTASLTRMGHYWIFVTETNFAPWKMIYCARNSDLIFYTLRHILPSLILAIVITTVFLICADRLIAREFIAPTNNLVNYIVQHAQQSAQDIQKIKEPWRSWFIEIRNVFNENRQLVKNLESDILQLDEKVALRTKDLFRKNKQLEKALDELKMAQNQIVTQEKLAGLGALTAGIAHEIRNPLNFILNFTEISQSFCQELLHFLRPLIKKLPIQEQQDIQEVADDLLTNMDRIQDHGRRADLIVRGMLSHARGDEDIIVQTDINVLIQENLMLALAGYKSRGFVPNIATQYDLSIPKLSLFAQDLGRVFLNIFNNACYALYEKYNNRIDIRELPTIHIVTYHKGDQVLITVQDNGPGISKAIRQKIFNPFFTTKPTGQGTGLGLSLSYEIIVNQHGGKFDVDSKLGLSTLFKITLPIS